MKTIIIGLGNPVLTDDAVGVKVARELKDKMKNFGIDVVELYAGGIRLVDALTGYDRAVIVDSMVTGLFDCGTFRSFSMSEFQNTRNTISMHDIDLPTAFEMGRMLGIKMPSEIKIWGIEAKDVETFSEDMTEDVAHALPEIVEKIIEDEMKILSSAGSVL